MAIYGGMYQDSDNPSGDYVHYQGRIKSDIILDKKIGVSFWNENSAIDFGYLDIAVNDQDSDLIDSPVEFLVRHCPRIVDAVSTTHSQQRRLSVDNTCSVPRP